MSPQNIKFIAPSQGASLRAITSPIPTTLAPKEVLIRLKAIAINPADFKMIDQGHRVSSWPLVAGLDGAGVVEDIGDQVTRFKKGDEVLAMFQAGNRGGAFQRYAIVEEKDGAKKPDGWRWEEGGSLGVSYLTALVALTIGLQIPIPLPLFPSNPHPTISPTSVLILGGSSSLGSSTIQLLRLVAPKCLILTTSSPKHHAHLLSLGADKALDRSSSNLVEHVKKATHGGSGVEAIVDTVGAGATSPNIFFAFDPKGRRRYAQVWTGDIEIEVPEGVDSYLFRGADVKGLEWGGNVMLSLEGLLKEGRYKLPLPVRNVGIGLEGIERGLGEVRRGVSGVKVVVGMDS